MKIVLMVLFCCRYSYAFAAGRCSERNGICVWSGDGRSVWCAKHGNFNVQDFAVSLISEANLINPWKFKFFCVLMVGRLYIWYFTRCVKHPQVARRSCHTWRETPHLAPHCPTKNTCEQEHSGIIEGGVEPTKSCFQNLPAATRSSLMAAK